MKSLKTVPALISLTAVILILASCKPDQIWNVDSEMFKTIKIRSIGPGTYAGRISDIEVHPGDRSTFFVSASTGGIFKTNDKGKTWAAIFDNAGKSLAIGDMTISVNNPDLIWVGTGEASGEQNPASIGDGIYKSLDGGQSWTNMGLTDTRHFSKVEIHPEDDNTVFAAATGARWGACENRGVYRTRDAGASWEKVLYINDNTGISDILVHPDGNTVLASAWEQRRHAWAHLRKGPNSGLYFSENSGDTWAKIENGIPQDNIGRIALAYALSNHDVIYACLEHDSLGLYRSDDRGRTWVNVNNKVSTSYWYGRIFVNPTDEDNIIIMGTWMQESKDGGKTFERIRLSNDVHVDHHVLWIDPDDTDQRLLGNDGGFYSSTDAGKSWIFHANMPIGQYYDISVDNRDPYWVYGGLQDNGVWGGPSESNDGRPVTNTDIVSVCGGDGFYSDSEPLDQNIVYGESQFGNIVRRDLSTNARERIRPNSEEGEPEYRFNWNTPFFISEHTPHELYIGAQKVLVSASRGDDWSEISPDLTLDQDLDSALVLGLKPTLKAYNTITQLVESPLSKGLIYAGTDDGKLHVTNNNGESWSDLSDSIPVPSDRFITRIIPSAHNEGRVYIGLGRFYEADDLKPYLFVSEDYGESWTDLGSTLPFPSVVRGFAEHPENEDLLFTGTHNALFISIDRGLTWIRPGCKLPYVAIDDILIQPDAGDLVLGSYGRGIWILDNIDFLASTSADSLSEEHILYDPEVNYSNLCADSVFVADPYHFIAPEPEEGIIISYYLNKTYKEGDRNIPQLELAYPDGNIIVIPEISTDRGFNRVAIKPEAHGDYTISIKTRRKTSRKVITY